MQKADSTLLKFIKASGIFLAGNALSKAVSFFLLPFYTAHIPPAGYGQYDLAVTYVGLITGFLFFDVWTSIMRFMYDEKELSGKYTIIQSGMEIFKYSTIAYCLVAVAVIILIDIQYAPLIALYGLSANLVTLYGFVARGLGKNKEFAATGVLGTIINASANILLLLVWNFDYSALYIAGILGALVQVIYLEFHIKIFGSFFSSSADKQLVRSMFRYSLPLCLNTVAYWLLTGFNRIIINITLGTEANGIYAVGAKFGVVISFVTTCFTYAWQDLSFAHTSEHGRDGVFFSKACNAYTKLLGVSAAVLISACYVIFPIMVDPSYSAVKDTIPLFLLVSLISALSTFIGNMFNAIKNTRIIFISMLISCMLNVALCIPLTRLLGLNGANIAACISFLLNIVIRYFILKKNISFGLDMKNIIIIIVWIGLSMLVYHIGTILINLIFLIVSSILALYWFKDMIQSLLGSFKRR